MAHCAARMCGALLKRDDFSSLRHPALRYCWSMIPALKGVYARLRGLCAGTGLFRKPVSTPAFARACFSGSCSRVLSVSIEPESTLVLLEWSHFLAENR